MSERGSMGREEGRKREEGREQEEKKPLRTNSQRVERSKMEGEEKKRRSSREGEEERRSRRALFQSVSTSNLSSGHQPSSSLPPHLPRFHLGDFGDLAIPAKLRGSRSLHASPAHPPASLQHRYGQVSRPSGHQPASLAVLNPSSQQPGSLASPCSCSSSTDSSRPPYYVSDTLAQPGKSMVDIRPTSELKERRVVRGEGCHDQPVQLRRHRSTHGLNDSEHYPNPAPSSRHSVHWDSAAHASSGLETLDFPPRKKTWPPDGSRFLAEYGQTERGEYLTTQRGGKDCASPGCGCGLINSAVYQKMITLADRQAEKDRCCYVVCCCPPAAPVEGCAPSPPPAAPSHSQCRRHQPRACTLPTGPGVQPRHSAGEGHLRPDAIHGDLTSLPVLQSGEMGPETASGLWSGVSGVPGLGVSIPRPRHGALEEWDRHDRGESQRSGRRRSEMVGSRVELPRVLSPRSSSCRSSGRSTGSQGSSSAVMSGGSSGGSAKYSSHSRRSDSGFSGGGGRQRQEESHHHHHHQSKPLSSGGRSSRREGGKRSRRGEAAPSPCECVCTCGDPVPPKPVRRVMFSDESCSCSDDEKMKSLPVHVSEGKVRGERCCGPPSLPMRGHSMRGVREEERKQDERHDEESSGCCSASPVPSHYQRPKDVDGDYSYAYSDSVSPAFLIRVGASMDYSAEDEESKENIYEEIRDKSEEQLYQADSRKSSTSSHEVSTTSSTKSRFQKALDAVTRRSSRSLEHGDRDRSFHMSISKGRKKTLIDRASVDWDCDPERGSGMKSRLNKSSNDMLEEVGSCHNKVMNQLKLDVEDMLMPPPSPPGDDTQDDSGFHSGGMSSSTSTEEQMSKTKRKSIIKTSKSTKRSESQPGRMNRCESIDFKEMAHEPGRKSSDQFRTRSKILAEQGGYGHYGHLPAPGIYTVHPPPPILVQSAGKKGTVGKSYLSKLVSLPFLGGTRQQPPVVYGKNNNHPKSFGEEQGRAFYL